MSSQLSTLIEKSKKILITSHISPDADALCSVLLSGLTIAKNLPDKLIEMVLEEPLTADLSFLAGFSEVKFAPLLSRVKEFEPDLVLIVDASTIERCSRLDGDELAKLTRDFDVAVVDHHMAEAPAYAELYINNRKPANVQQLYETFFEQMSLQKPDGYADITLLGIIFDTGRFKYDNPDHKNTFRIVSGLLDAGASIEKLENRLDRFSKDELEVLANLAGNVTVKDGFSYSFVDDEFADDWKKNDRPQRDFKAGCEQFVNRFIRNIEKNNWGFVVYPEIAAANKTYSVSFRAEAGTKDVAGLASRLGGGGHKEAAGAKNIEAPSVEEAVAQVLNLIK